MTIMIQLFSENMLQFQNKQEGSWENEWGSGVDGASEKLVIKGALGVESQWRLSLQFLI